MVSTIHLLEDGRRVRVRMARPGDPLPDHLTLFDPRERLVLTAVELIGGQEQIVGVAEVDLSERTLGEGVRELLADAATRPRAA